MSIFRSGAGGVFPAVALTTTLAAALAAAPATAEELINGSDPNAILNVASGFGSANLQKDDYGDPLIEGRIDGLLYYVLFYGCEEAKNCTAIQFSASFEDPKLDLAKINEWNKGKRFGAAFLDAEGDVTLQYDMNLAHGVTRENLDDTFDYWSVVMSEFEGFLGW